MMDFQLREDNVEIGGRVVSAWQDVSPPYQIPTDMWHLLLELSPGDPRLISSDGTVNPLGRIECLVTPPAPYRDPSHLGLLTQLSGMGVRVSGSWGDLSADGVPLGTVIWPIAWIVADRGLVPIVQEQGFTQAVADVDVYAFSDDCVTEGLQPNNPPHHRQDRHLVVTVPFPFRPQPTAVAQWVECTDREDRERALYFGRSVPRPDFPVRAVRAQTATVVAAGSADTLEVTIDTGTPGAGQGFLYTRLALTYDEGFETMCPPDVCLTDPTRSCQATGEDRYSYVWPRFASVRVGDLILGPSGPGGVLGRLLGQLNPPQYYDHMGIFVANDGATIRHCTASDERVQDPEYYNGRLTVNTPFGDMEEKIPLKGIREDVLKYAWPGSITQSLAEVTITGRNRLNPQFSFSTLYPAVAADEAADPPRLWQLVPEERRKRTGFHDPEAAGAAKRMGNAGRRRVYSLIKLQKDPAWRPEIDPATGAPIGWLWPVIVQPHPRLANTAYRALAVVAARASQLRAHYRFFAYTKGDIATNAAFDAPGPGAWGPDEGRDWAAGSIAAVCSSFVWAAVQAANPQLAAAGGATIELEGETEPTDGRWPGSADGLYAYQADERRDSGKALYQFTADRVAAEVDKKVNDLPGIVTTVLDVMGVLSGTSPTDQVRDYLAQTVANQLCNVFGADNPGDFADTWANAGPGSAVSPDDTMLRWDVNAPADAWPTVRPGRVNVYGRAVPVAVPRAGWRREPVYRVAPVQGLGTVRGIVVRREEPDRDPVRVAGATVRFGCRVTSTDPEGQFSFVDTKAGPYHLRGAMFVVDRKTRVGTEWSSPTKLIELRPGDDLGGLVLELEPPPGVARDVVVQSHHDVVDRRVVGKDAWGHFDLNGTIPLAYDPLDLPQAPPGQRNTLLRAGFDQTTPEVGSGVHVRVRVDAWLKEITAADGSVHYDGTVVADLTLVFFDAEEGEINARLTKTGVELPLGESFTMPYNLVSDDTVPERASGHVTVHNTFAVLS